MAMKIFIHTTLLLTLLFSNNCSSTKYPIVPSELTYRGKFDNNKQFRLDGIYFLLCEKKYVSLKYFFQDGTYFAVGIDSLNLSRNECRPIVSGTGEIPYYWGYFIVTGDTIKVQAFDPTSRQRYSKFRVEEKWAIIENDTTIRFFKKISPEHEVIAMDETYHFKQCSNKPDSTNILMEYFK